ncbi:uncharacterized protein F4822DRAFT_171939 [Hypoxylon trugodes]|uniref:uncharacterized protein n=1 Tax=Hypoxylon trugodes TaxID=326681 RepID=UPI0021906A2A|nr:uncharacterized protein F4822DRAFT_171939 [Hypoxylon trugodes]KAI1391079.1 hypothetical protein F4822DRAFT_171939 [Hypoxylon trugodes]
MDPFSEAEKGQAPTTPISGSRDEGDHLNVSSLANQQARNPRQEVLGDSVGDIVSSMEVLAEPLHGLARAAALQSCSYNLSHQRQFSTLWHRLLLELQRDITKLEGVWARLNENDSGVPISQLREQGLTESNGGNRASNHPLFQSSAEQACSRDLLFKKTFDRLKLYTESVLLVHQLQKLPRTSRWEWSSLYQTFKGENLLKDSSWNFLCFQDDFLSTRAERADRTFAGLVYGDAPLSRLFRWIFKIRNRECKGNEAKARTMIYLHTGGMESLKNGLVATGSGIILMVPVGILLLQPMDKVTSLVVVVCFGAAFIFVLMLLGKGLDTMLYSFSAYVAVLASFLANIQSNGTPAC